MVKHTSGILHHLIQRLDGIISSKVHLRIKKIYNNLQTKYMGSNSGHAYQLVGEDSKQRTEKDNRNTQKHTTKESPGNKHNKGTNHREDGRREFLIMQNKTEK